MLTGLSQRLLTVLQLTRMALVFTAIADAQCGLLLRVGAGLRAGQTLVLQGKCKGARDTEIVFTGCVVVR